MSRKVRVLGAAALLATAMLALGVFTASAPRANTPAMAEQAPVVQAGATKDHKPAAQPSEAPAAETARARRAANTAVDQEVPLLPPQSRRKTLMVAAPAVLACLAEANLATSELDPAMHARLHVAPVDGKVRVTQVELVDGDEAPVPFQDCVLELLGRIELDLPADTNGLVITPPLAGHPADHAVLAGADTP